MTTDIPQGIDNPTSEIAGKARIDYGSQYSARFGMSKLLAERQGLRYEHPSRAGIGWKIHLAVSHISSDPLTKRIAAFIEESRFLYKVGDGGSQEEGKGMTIYIGDRDTMEDLAQKLTENFGDEIPEPRGDVLGTDMQIVGKVWGRFENIHDGNKNKLAENGHRKYRQYGPSGVPALEKDDDMWEAPEIRQANRDLKRQSAIVALTQDYGAFFTGTRNHPI